MKQVGSRFSLCCFAINVYMPESRQNNASPFNQLPEDDVYLVKVGGARTIDW